MLITELKVERYRQESESGEIVEIQMVRVITDSELVGSGFVSANALTGDLCAAILERVLAPVIKGGDPRLNLDLWERMVREAIARRGGDGLVRFCVAAVDMALWDIRGQLMGAPVSTVLGGNKERVLTYANCAHHMAPDELAERAASYVARGHRALKIRGTRTFVTPAEATARVAAVREAVGPDVRLMVDVNGTWDVDTAIQQLKRWERYDVYWLEEPVPPSDLAGYVRVRARSGSTYIVGGEQHVGLTEFKALIESGAVDIVQPNAAITGGITDWLRIHAFATAHSVPVSPWDLQMIHLHMAAGLPNVQWIEYFMADNALLQFQTRLFSGPALREQATEDGVYLLAPDTPGIGLKLDESVAERARMPA